MKIKCPACSKVLNVPESAAGKIIKCPCGKQLRAPHSPARPAKPSTAPTKTAPRPVGSKPSAQRPTRQQPATPGSLGGSFDDDLFGELTDEDLQPVLAVHRPGTSAAAATSATTNTKLSKASKSAVAEREERKAELRGGAAKEMWSSIGILCVLGAIRVIWNIVQLVGVEAIVTQISASPTFDGDVEMLLTIFRIIFIARIIIGSLFFVCAGFFFVFPMTSAIAAIIIFVLFEIFSLIVNPFLLISIRGWIARGVMFGLLVQSINNASYYKYVKSGARDND